MKRILVLLILISTTLLTAETIIDEGFNSISLPDEWSQEYEQGNNSWMTYQGGHNGNPSGPHSGTRNAYIFAESCTTKLITPMLNIGGSSSATLSFWYAHTVWAGHQDILNIYYKTEPTGNWIQIESYLNNITEWTQVNLNLPSESSSYFIAFEAVCDWGHGVVLDDVLIEGDPSPVGVVEGHVYNENSIPLAGAEVLIEDINMSTTSVPGGFYQIVAVPEGTHPFFASLEGYGFDMTSATIIAGETITLDFYLNEYIEIIVNGTVLTSISNEPVQGATVTLEGFADYQTQTAANGQFIIPGVYSENEYELSVTKPDFNPYYETITIEDENYNCGTINIYAPVEISGWVNTTAHPDSGLFNAQISLTGYATHNTTTDSLGYFLIENVYANEDYQIDISYPNHNPFSETLEITAYDVDMDTVTLISPVALYGHVVTNIDPNTGVEGAEIELAGYANHSTFSDSMGNFIINEIYANEDYQLTVSFTNHHIHTENISI